MTCPLDRIEFLTTIRALEESHKEPLEPVRGTGNLLISRGYYGPGAEALAALTGPPGVDAKTEQGQRNEGERERRQPDRNAVHIVTSSAGTVS
jgi:hypothetical protein